MGSCQSSTAGTLPESSKPRDIPTNKEDVSDKPKSLSAPTVQWPDNGGITDSERPTVPSKPTKTVKLKKGYSSGASSFSSETDQKHHRRDTSDLLGLEDLKTTLLTDGDIGTNVVRMETPFGKSIENVYDGVHDGEILGSGVSGLVRLVTHKETQVKYAVKILDIGLVKSETVLDQLREEIYIMLQLDHPNIVRLEEVYESQNEIYIVQELCLGGDLFDRLDMQPDYHYTEAQCARLVKQMLSGVRYLHSKNIVHRDLKLENFLFSTPDPDSVLQMIDFGLSKHFQFGVPLHEAVGTPYAVAPEIIRGSYNEKSDMWSIGVLTYLLLSGETPFGGCDGEDLLTVRDNILSGTLSFEPKETWSNVSDLGKDFVRMLLNPHADDRPSAKQAQRHTWIHEFSSKHNKEGNNLDPQVVKALVQFKEISDMRKLLSEVLSFTLLPEQINDLRTEFEKIDTDGSGEISLAALKQVLLESAEAGSLGALTEAEVEDIFNAMRVRKSETTIRWHEFIAAGLSQCRVDDRNLKLAFDRLDTGGKGFITFENLKDLMGMEGNTNKEELEMIWMDGISQYNLNLERITYEDFKVLMKGQAPERVSSRRLLASGGMPAPSRARRSRSVPNIETSRKSSKKLEEEENIEPGTPVSIERTPSKRLYVRQKSRSLEARKASKWFSLDEDDMFQSTTVLLAGRDDAEVRNVLSDDLNSPLVVNRALYRAHREMRLAVLDASKRFEEDQARRRHARLLAEGKKNGSTLHRRASLTMRRGSVPDLECPTEQDDTFDTEKEQVKNLQEDASHRGGRPRKKRMKTVSDMTGLMNAYNRDDSPSRGGSRKSMG